MDLGQYNRTCRFFVADYSPSPLELSRYDRTGMPLRTYRVYRGLPVVPVSFVNLRWCYGHNPRSTRATKSPLAGRSPSLLIVDMCPRNSIRVPHARFVIPSCVFPEKLTHDVYLSLRCGTWDQYLVGESDLVATITRMAGDRQEVSFGRGQNPTIVQSREYCCLLERAMSQAAIDWVLRLKDVGEEA